MLIIANALAGILNLAIGIANILNPPSDIWLIGVNFFCAGVSFTATCWFLVERRFDR